MAADGLTPGNEIISLERCRLVITAAGTLVYAPDGTCLGLYETEDAAVEMIRLQMKDYSEGGSSDEI